jgi:ribonuclease-3
MHSSRGGSYRGRGDSRGRGRGYGRGRGEDTGTRNTGTRNTETLTPPVNPQWVPRTQQSGFQFQQPVPPSTIQTHTNLPDMHPEMSSLRQPKSNTNPRPKPIQEVRNDPPKIESKEASPIPVSSPPHKLALTNSLEPWNDKNVLLSETDVYSIFERAGFHDAREKMKINRLEVYQRAFVHSSYVAKTTENGSLSASSSTPSGSIPLFEEDYENQEFLGDRVLELSIAFYIFRRYPNTDQGFKTVLKTKLVRKDTLAKFAKHLDLPKHIIISKQVEEQTQDGRYNDRILEDVMEAFICAIFLDQNDTPYYSSVVSSFDSMRLIGPGWSVANAFIEYLLESAVDFEELISKQENYKEQLLQYCQRQFNMTPQYISISVEGPENRRIFTQGVLDKNGNVVGRGVASKKTDAEQKASLEALKYYGEL